MEILKRLFIKNYQDINNEKVRASYGKVSSIFGIFLNICLFLMKFIVGTMFHSVSIRADAFNNLSDAGSSIVSLFSFIYASRPADKDHPFGHARFEYIGSLIVSMFIMLFAYELVSTSISHILHPVPLTFDTLMIIVLFVSICIKSYMYIYNHKYGKLLNSTVLKATAIDSLSDCISTTMVIVAILISKFTTYNLDPYMGIIVALFIFKSGIDIIKETVDKLLGAGPDAEFENRMKVLLSGYPGILGIHDVTIHSYGESHVFISAHAEMDASLSLVDAHDIIDGIERDFRREHNVELVIHIDPIIVGDKEVYALKEDIEKHIHDIHSHISMHDFQIVLKKKHYHISFDLRIHSTCPLHREDVLECLQMVLPRKWKDIDVEYIIDFDEAYSTSSYSEHKL